MRHVRTNPFNQLTDQHIRNAISSLKARYMSSAPAVNVTREDIFFAFVKPEHQELARIASDVFDTRYISASFTVRHFYIELGRSADFTLPRYAGKIDTYNMEDPHTRSVIKRLTEYGAWVKDAEQKFKNIYTVFERLCDLCKLPTQVRFYWPALLSLMEQIPKDAPPMVMRADALRDFKVPSALPRIPQELRELCVSTATTIAMALLLPKNIERNDEIEVRIN